MIRFRFFALAVLVATIPALARAATPDTTAPAETSTPPSTAAAPTAPPAKAPARHAAPKKKAVGAQAPATAAAAPAKRPVTETGAARTLSTHARSAAANRSTERAPVSSTVARPVPVPAPLPPLRPRPAPPPVWSTFGIRLAGGVVNPVDPAADIVTENGTLGGWSAGVDWHPSRVPAPLAFQVAYEGAASNASLFGTGTAYLTRHSLALGARWRLVQFGGAQVYGRGALLFDANHLALDDNDGGAELADWAFSAGLGLAAGAQYTFGDSGTDRGFAVFGEIGWAERLSPSFDALTRAVQGSPKPAPVENVPVDVGSFNLSGLFWNLGLGYLW